jgi:CheY-like chemotaxis protein
MLAEEFAVMATILILDDNPTMVELMCETLEILGHRPICGRNGLEGLDLLANADPFPDLIICDMNMPKMNGSTFIAEVRSQPEWASIPVLVLSGSDDDNFSQRIPDAQFLEKPFSMPRLNDLIESLLGACA